MYLKNNVLKKLLVKCETAIFYFGNTKNILQTLYVYLMNNPSCTSYFEYFSRTKPSKVNKAGYLIFNPARLMQLAELRLCLSLGNVRLTCIS